MFAKGVKKLRAALYGCPTASFWKLFPSGVCLTCRGTVSSCLFSSGGSVKKGKKDGRAVQ